MSLPPCVCSAEKLPQLLDAARAVIAATRKEDGCVSYDLHQSITEPSEVGFRRALGLA